MGHARPAGPRQLMMVGSSNMDTPTCMLGKCPPGGMLDLGLMQEPDSEAPERGVYSGRSTRVTEDKNVSQEGQLIFF